ncbi:RNA polymerase sigma factor [Echinicola jeungdonensis]|uniref:RNA polymerase sigma factor n=1 Tax=Echinicola jeungdonensis TaxID=709343 RepID=A0ABV5J216_9BACT|nr:RNA polymerase sigma factor [Echinicola jeungdonensis]MDN3667783.1 RNA polymerase sigma factor [Echinicola jeungdonensis]
MKKELTKSLLEGLLKGDQKSQELLYKQFYSYGMSISLRFTANREEAVEVLNDGFMKIFNKISQFNPDQPFKPWFRRILINTSINHYKKYIHQNNNADLDQVKKVSDQGQDIMGEISYQEIIQLLQNLSPKYRTVFNLNVIEGYSHEEIADMLQISVGTSKSNLSRARANLRSMLTRSHEKGLEKYER